MEHSQAKRSRNSVNWTKESLTRFFEMHPCLYDTKSKFYSNKHARADALLKICDALEMPGLTAEDVKQKINNVRTQLSHELKKIQGVRSGDGTDDKHEPIWWFDLAQFLLSHIKKRKGNDCLEDNLDAQDSALSTPQGEDFSTESNATPKRKMSKLKNDSSEVSIYNKTLNTLDNLNEALHCTKQIEACKEMEFGTSIAKELSEIDDAELLLEAKHEINNIVYHYRKQCIEAKKRSYEIVF